MSSPYHPHLAPALQREQQGLHLSLPRSEGGAKAPTVSEWGWARSVSRPLLGQVDPTTLFNREPVHPALLERTATMVQPRLDGKHSTSGGSGGRQREDA